MSCARIKKTNPRDETNSPKVSRTDSYRAALRKSGADIDKQQSKAKNVSIKVDDDENEEEKQKLLNNLQIIITNQPINKSINNDYNSKVETENNGNTKKSVDYNEEITVMRDKEDNTTTHRERDITKSCSRFCCEKCCCNYWVCCPDCFFQKLKAVETCFTGVSNSCMNKVRVFT